MKKELIAAILLCALLICGALNTHFLGSFTGEICSALEVSGQYCASGEYPRALTLAEAAHGLWHGRALYAGIFIRHSETDAVSYGFHELISALETEPEGAAALYAALIAHVRSLYDMERVTLGSVF